MTTTMKILIAYDGSECADQAIDDLQRAGLPAEAEALVVSIEEEWMPPPLSSYTMAGNSTVVAGSMAVQMAPDLELQEQEAEKLALRAQQKVQAMFPAWKISERVVSGSPASKILQIADEWNADLLVVGSHGRTALGRFVFGSVSHKIVTHANCTVRVSRCGSEDSSAPEKILIGVDGSLGAEVAIEEVARRKFPAATEVRLIVVLDPLKPTLVGNLVPGVRSWVDEGNREDREWAKNLVNQQAEGLRKAGFTVSCVVKQGDPRRVLVDEAEDWQATTIFIGARGLNAVDRFLLGSVSAAVSQRAACTVEVVRPSRGEHQQK